MSVTAERDELLTAADVAAWLRCTKEHVYDLYRRGELQGVKVGRIVRIFKDSVQAILDAGRRRVQT